MLTLGRGKWAVSKKPKLTRNKLHAPILSHKACSAIYMLSLKVPQSMLRVVFIDRSHETLNRIAQKKMCTFNKCRSILSLQMCITGGLGIPGSARERTSSRNVFVSKAWLHV